MRLKLSVLRNSAGLVIGSVVCYCCLIDFCRIKRVGILAQRWMRLENVISFLAMKKIGEFTSSILQICTGPFKSVNENTGNLIKLLKSNVHFFIFPRNEFSFIGFLRRNLGPDTITLKHNMQNKFSISNGGMYQYNVESTEF